MNLRTLSVHSTALVEPCDEIRGLLVNSWLPNVVAFVMVARPDLTLAERVVPRVVVPPVPLPVFDEAERGK